jgi:serine/threonine protein kinase
VFDFLYVSPEVINLKKNKMALYEEKRFSLKQAIEDTLKTTKERQSFWEYDGNEQYKEETRRTIVALEGARHQMDLFLGKGNAAFVCSVPEIPEVCIKFLHTPGRQLFSIEKEFGVLSDASSLPLKTLKIPEAHAVAKNVNGAKAFFTMKTVDGYTLLELVEHPSKRESLLNKMGISETELLEKLLNQTLHREIVEDLTTIHRSGIIHGDIHPRNIMLDSKGDLYLIDFGNAVIPVTLNQTSDELNENIENIKENDISGFINSMKNTALEIRKNR